MPFSYPKIISGKSKWDLNLKNAMIAASESHNGKFTWDLTLKNDMIAAY